MIESLEQPQPYTYVHIYLPQDNNFFEERVKIDSHREKFRHSVSLVILPADLLQFLE